MQAGGGAMGSHPAAGPYGSCPPAHPDPSCQGVGRRGNQRVSRALLLACASALVAAAALVALVSGSGSRVELAAVFPPYYGGARMQSLVSWSKPSDFPYAQEVGKAGPPVVEAAPQRQFTVVSEGSQKLASDDAEPTADDSPVGLASAAKILKEADKFEESKGSDAWDSWKGAVKGSGDKILGSITDDVTSFNPFPTKSASEAMEVQDVWNKAREMAKPAGSLDGDADETKKSIENAEAQADASAYMAANEAAAVDAYDVSMPNVDMMAKGQKNAMTGQALAGGPHTMMALHGQAAAVHRRQQSLGSRVQALALLPETSFGSKSQLMARRAAADAARAHNSIVHDELKIAEERGEELEARRLQMALKGKSGLSTRALAEKRSMLDRALVAAQKARKQAMSAGGRSKAKKLHSLKQEESQLKAQREHLIQEQKVNQQKLAVEQADGQKLEGDEAEDADAEDGEEGPFDESKKYDQRTLPNHNILSDALNIALGDERRPMEEIDADEHAGYPPLNLEQKHGKINWSNGMNQGWDPVEYLGAYDSRTAQQIYEPEEKDAEEDEQEGSSESEEPEGAEEAEE